MIHVRFVGLFLGAWLDERNGSPVYFGFYARREGASSSRGDPGSRVCPYVLRTTRRICVQDQLEVNEWASGS